MHIKCEVFTTVSSMIRKENFFSTHPQLIFLLCTSCCFWQGSFSGSRPGDADALPGRSDAQQAKGIPSLPAAGNKPLLCGST